MLQQEENHKKVMIFWETKHKPNATFAMTSVLKQTTQGEKERLQAPGAV